MTALDHSSPEALLADLLRHCRDGCVFQFRWRKGIGADWSWTLIDAGILPDRCLWVHLCGTNGGMHDQWDFWLNDDGWLSTIDGLKVVELVLEGGPPPCGGVSGSSLGAYQPDRLDKNLRGVFA